MGIGLSGAFGVAGAYDSLDQILASRVAAQKYADQQRQQAIENQLRERQFQSNEELKRAQLDATMHSQQAAEADRQTGLANTLGEQIPAGTVIAPTDPAVGMLRSGGRGSLLQHQTASLGSTQLSGFSGIPGQAPPAGAGLLRTQNAGHPEQYIKQASAGQINTQADNARADAQLARTEAAQSETVRHNQAMENKPQGASTVTIQTVDDQGNPVTRVLPKSEAMGKDFKKPAGSALENRLASAQTVNQLGNDMIAKLADPKIAGTLGPIMGRYSTLQEFIGNPPPEFAELAGEIESYALANMGVHGMRSAQGAEMIKRLMSARHTPQSLAATIQGLNQFSENFARNAGRGTPAPAAPAAGGGVKVLSITPVGR